MQVIVETPQFTWQELPEMQVIVETPQFTWQELPEIPVIEKYRSTSRSVLFQIETGEVYFGHYNSNGFFYNDDTKDLSLFFAKGNKPKDTGFGYASPKHQVIRWCFLKQNS